MTIKTYPNTQPAPPQSITPEQFAGRMKGLHSAIAYEDPTPKHGVSARDDWYRLDPLETVVADERGKRVLLAAARAGAAVCNAVVRTNSRRKVWTSVQETGPQMLLDAAQLEAQLPNPDWDSVINDTEATMDAVQGAAVTKKGRYDRGGVSNVFDGLSARSLNSYARSRQLIETDKSGHWRQAGRTMLRAAVGGIVQDTVGHIKTLHELYQAESNGARKLTIGGDLGEAMYFAYRAAEWYRSPTIEEGYVRFALSREDKPNNQGVRPRRSFDVAIVGTAGVEEAVQVKSGRGADYAEGITVWHGRPDLLDNAPQAVEWFRTLVNSRSTEAEVSQAMNRIGQQFAPVR